VVLVDTSVWVSHLRDGNAELEELLNSEEVLCHAYIIGELACGNLKNRTEILALFKLLPKVPLVGDEEVLRFIDDNNLMGKGLGYIDLHLAASAMLAGVSMWTFDKRLVRVNEALNISYK
jgi:predicted nucleic acid-binding protein